MKGVIASTGSYVLATWLAGMLYDREARKFPSGACRGPNCFRPTFLIVAAASAVALLLSIMLHRRTLPLYERVIQDTIAERKRRGREVRTLTATSDIITCVAKQKKQISAALAYLFTTRRAW